MLILRISRQYIKRNHVYELNLIIYVQLMVDNSFPQIIFFLNL
jgi:hypothetical protein